MSAEALSERPPTREETQKASEAISAMSRVLSEDRGLPLGVVTDGDEVRIELPPSVGHLVLDLLAHIARGEMVTLVPYGADLTTQKAADLLNVSRPFLIKLLEGGDIPFHTVGNHRRVRVQDLLQYKSARDDTRKKALKKLQKLGQEFEAG